MIRVLIADDQALVRAGFKMILEAEPGIEVVGEAVDGQEAVEQIRLLAAIPSPTGSQNVFIGTFCTYTLVHAKQAIPVDPALPKPQMSLIGCGVMTGVGAATRIADSSCTANQPCS